MRWLDPELVAVGEANPPVSVNTAKAHLRVDDAASDALIGGYLSAAQSYVERVTGLRLVEQTVKLRAYGFGGQRWIWLPAAPIQSITSVKYLDVNGDEQTLDPSIYTADLYGLTPSIALVYGQCWPPHRVQAGSVTIEVVCGFADGTCPAAISQAILLLVGDWFSNRETTDPNRVQAIEMVAVDALLANFRRAYL